MTRSLEEECSKGTTQLAVAFQSKNFVVSLDYFGQRYGSNFKYVLRWIWTIDLLIFNQSHLPLSYQDIKLEYFVLRSDTSLPTKHNESEPSVPNTKRRGPRKGIEMGGNYVATRSGGETKRGAAWNHPTLMTLL